MKKNVNPARFGKKPRGWPTEDEWTALEKKFEKSLPIKVLSESAGPVETAKHEICSHFVRYFKAARITQREMADRLGVAESRISEILHYHFERFTIDKLLELLSKIRPHVKIKVA